MRTDWQELPRAPALPGLFARAALRRGIRGRILPSRGLACTLSVDPDNLARYRELCGYADDGRLPSAYPHILAFALQLKLLTASDFPFPLLGLVHLENRIRVLRTLGGLGPFRISVTTERLTPHDKGVTFSVITRLEDQLGLLWEGDSRILYRGLRLEGTPPARVEPEPLPLEEIAHWHAPADIGRRYARVAGDFNPIHMTGPTAKLFGFPRAIAHGLWNKGRALSALGERLPDSGYEVEVRFQKPVLLPGDVRLLASAPAPEGQFVLRGRKDLPHMSGVWRPIVTTTPM
ncbi:MAG TPA: MaoC/PaaZ C-terminal domain-containing protein [Pseudomonas sp.]|jgi:acyl dehydratase|nr:MaoC/PaaZ C-terminal domain-containing protein [Pseudomonas sp.]